MMGLFCLLGSRSGKYGVGFPGRNWYLCVLSSYVYIIIWTCWNKIGYMVGTGLLTSTIIRGSGILLIFNKYILPTIVGYSFLVTYHCVSSKHLDGSPLFPLQDISNMCGIQGIYLASPTWSLAP